MGFPLVTMLTTEGDTFVPTVVPFIVAVTEYAFPAEAVPPHAPVSVTALLKVIAFPEAGVRVSVPPLTDADLITLVKVELPASWIPLRTAVQLPVIP